MMSLMVKVTFGSSAGVAIVKLKLSLLSLNVRVKKKSSVEGIKYNNKKSNIINQLFYIKYVASKSKQSF